MMLYIDPGSGYILLQIIIAAFASVLLFFKKIRDRVKNFFKRKK